MRITARYDQRCTRQDGHHTQRRDEWIHFHHSHQKPVKKADTHTHHQRHKNTWHNRPIFVQQQRADHAPKRQHRADRQVKSTADEDDRHADRDDGVGRQSDADGIDIHAGKKGARARVDQQRGHNNQYKQPKFTGLEQTAPQGVEPVALVFPR